MDGNKIYKYEMHLHTSACSACARSTAAEMVQKLADLGGYLLHKGFHSILIGLAFIDGRFEILFRYAVLKAEVYLCVFAGIQYDPTFGLAKIGTKILS